MKNLLISVIVPVFNAEAYLRKCVKSIIKQTYNNLDIILVDDGSTDKSWSILEELKKLDSRIRITHQENHGVSVARNTGISMALGEYLAFIDSDDWIDNDYFDVLYENTMNGDVAYSVCLLKTYEKDKSLGYQADFSCEGLFLGYSYELFSAMLQNYGIFGPYCKLYKKSIIDEYQVMFREGIVMGEDLVFNLSFLKHANKIAIKNKSLYYYRNNDKGLCHNFHENKIQSFKFSNKFLYDHAKENDFLKPDFFNFYRSHVLNDARIYLIKTIKGKEKIRKKKIVVMDILNAECVRLCLPQKDTIKRFIAILFRRF